MIKSWPIVAVPHAGLLSAPHTSANGAVASSGNPAPTLNQAHSRYSMPAITSIWLLQAPVATSAPEDGIRDGIQSRLDIQNVSDHPHQWLRKYWCRLSESSG